MASKGLKRIGVRILLLPASSAGIFSLDPGRRRFITWFDMYRVFKNLTFCYAHRLWNYSGRCARLHGHNALVQVDFARTALTPTGMVVDFDEIKALVQSYLDEELDHRTILFRDDPLTEKLKEWGEPVVTMDQNPTAENLARMIFDFVKAKGLPIASVQVWETPSSCAEYSERNA